MSLGGRILRKISLGKASWNSSNKGVKSGLFGSIFGSYSSSELEKIRSFKG